MYVYRYRYIHMCVCASTCVSRILIRSHGFDIRWKSQRCLHLDHEYNWIQYSLSTCSILKCRPIVGARHQKEASGMSGKAWSLRVHGNMVNDSQNCFRTQLGRPSWRSRDGRPSQNTKSSCPSRKGKVTKNEKSFFENENYVLRNKCCG